MKNEDEKVVSKAFFSLGLTTCYLLSNISLKITQVTLNYQKAPNWHGLNENQKSRHSPCLHKIN